MGHPCIWCNATIYDRDDSVELCDECEEISEFVEHPSQIRGDNLLRSYGLNYTDYKKIYIQQNGECAICGHDLSLYKNDSGVEVACVDHDHQTGDVRGLLCGICNSGLGFFKDSPRRLMNAAEYLKKHNK